MASMMMVMHVSYYDDESDHTVHCTQRVSPFKVTQNEFFVQKSGVGRNVCVCGGGGGIDPRDADRPNTLLK